MTPERCALCGVENVHVSVALVEWAEPLEGQRFSAVARCTDVKACRERVERFGQRWEVVEAAA